ncbi:hypothetical protein SAMN05428981_1081 [Bacillus sp. OV194]|nr:hypothetical protein SAMN05428981_1081 [Bacillus sp. OV194]
MFRAHGIGYEEYKRKLNHRLKVEQKRENDYFRSIRTLQGVRTNPIRK